MYCLFAQDAVSGSSHQSITCNVSENNAVISIFEQIFTIFKKHQNRKKESKSLENESWEWAAI